MFLIGLSRAVPSLGTSSLSLIFVWWGLSVNFVWAETDSRHFLRFPIFFFICFDKKKKEDEKLKFGK